MRSRSILVMSFATLAVVLGACGSSKDKAPSKADYIASADKICASSGKAVNAAAATLTQSSTAADFASFQKIAVPALRSELTAIRALKQPSGDSAALNAIYDEVERVTQQLADAAPTDLPKIFASDPFGVANKKSVAYGFKECGK